MNAPELRPVVDLRPYAGNAKRHPPEQIEQLARTFEALGFVGAIVVRDGTIAKGHGSLKAVESIYARGGLLYPAPGREQGAEPFPAGTVPVLDVTGWTESQFRAYVIADNRLAEGGDWDAEILRGELDALSEQSELDDFDFDRLGLDFDDALSALDEDERTVDANAAHQRDAEGSAPAPATTGAATAAKPQPKKPTVYPVMISLNRAQYDRLQAFKDEHDMSDADVLMRGI
jgi:ParB-like chromosome segregation protein Spo0J